ncbi:hypothetical protein GPX89_19785 [Nocardia sp. ET3-3]|uniref:Uncharacterized protein n=1 Tax=Nocardia terrae TaxID=2675851 RepID=A0A7K1UYL6_9NOCA|nr:hypothetical protein [Nocardia terrae]MVU79476.1 hypothetical protein [Nocardia terrae]
MRIIRSNDDHDDDHEHQHNRKRGSGGPNELGELVAGLPDGQVGDILGDEASAFIAAATVAADGPGFPLGLDVPEESIPAKPVLRLVTPEKHLDTAPSSPAQAGLRPRLLRAGLGGSALVAVILLIADWRQPAVVAAPLAVYGLGWVAYLWWNAALRPPLPQTLIALTTAIGRALAALLRGICRTFTGAIARMDRSRDRHETRRTATA